MNEIEIRLIKGLSTLQLLINYLSKADPAQGASIKFRLGPAEDGESHREWAIVETADLSIINTLIHTLLSAEEDNLKLRAALCKSQMQRIQAALDEYARYAGEGSPHD